MRPVVTDRVARFVCLSVWHDRDPGKNGWTDRDAVWWNRVGPGNHVLPGGSRSPHVNGQLWGRKRGRPRTGRDGRYIQCGRFAGWDVLDWGCTYWRNLANMTEPSVCGGDAALCQITLTTCVDVKRTWNATDSIVLHGCVHCVAVCRWYVNTDPITAS